jgi:hypothetical protein
MRQYIQRRLISSATLLKECLLSHLPLEEERERCFDRFAKNVLPALFPIWRDRAGLRGGCVRRKPEAPRQNPQSQHVKGIADEKGRLKPPDFEHPRDCVHRLTGRPAFVLDQNGAVRNPVFPRVVSSHSRFAGGVAGSCSTREYQQRRQMAVPQIECVIEPGAKDRRWFTRILRSSQYDYRLGRPRFITRAPNENSCSGCDPESKCGHDRDRQYSPNDLYGMFCFRRTLHPYESTLESMSRVRLRALNGISLRFQCRFEFVLHRSFSVHKPNRSQFW